MLPLDTLNKQPSINHTSVPSFSSKSVALASPLSTNFNIAGAIPIPMDPRYYDNHFKEYSGAPHIKFLINHPKYDMNSHDHNSIQCPQEILDYRNRPIDQDHTQG